MKSDQQPPWNSWPWWLGPWIPAVHPRQGPVNRCQCLQSMVIPGYACRDWSLHVSPHACTYLNGLVEDAGADLDHLKVLFLLVSRTLDICHPAAMVLLAGVDKVANSTILVEHLVAGGKGLG